MKSAVAALAAAFAFSFVVGAQDAPTPAPAAVPDAPPVTDWTDIETVVVHGEARGPAMWRLSKGDSEIWILGVLGPLPHALAWNRTRLAETVKGARKLYTRAQASASLLGMSWFFLTHWGITAMPDGQRLEASLPEDLRTRFVAVRESIGQKADRYEDRKPLIAAMRLVEDYQKARKLNGDGATRAVAKIADEADVDVAPIAEYDATPLIKEALKLPTAEGQACLAAVLTDIENWDKHATAAADAWAVGDIEGIKAHYAPSSMELCLTKTRSYYAMRDRAVNDAMKLIRRALSKPGKIVMLVEIGTLLRSQGVVEKLHAEGIAIEGPL